MTITSSTPVSTLFIVKNNADAFRSVERGDSVTAYNGFIGKVVSTRRSGYDTAVKVECVYSRRTEDVGKTFDIDYFSRIQIGCIPEGTKVRGIGTVDGESIDGLEGIIVCIDDNHDNAIYGVLFYEFTKGHNLNERLPKENGQSSNKGWFVRSYNFEIIEPPALIGEIEYNGFSVGDRVKLVSSGETGIIRYIRPNYSVDNPYDIFIHNDVYEEHAYKTGVCGIWGENLIVASGNGDIEHTDDDNYAFKVGDIITPLMSASGYDVRRSNNPFRSSHRGMLGRVLQVLTPSLIHVVPVDVYDNPYFSEHFPYATVYIGDTLYNTYVVNVYDFKLVRHADEPVEKSRFYCTYCGEELHEECIIRKVGKYPELVPEYEDDKYFITASGDVICEDCMGEDFHKCHDCGRIYHTDDMEWIEDIDDYVCEECKCDNYYWCDRCEAYHTTTNEVYIDEDCRTEDWCEDCCCNHASWCDSCGHYYDWELSDCPNCYEEDEDEEESYDRNYYDNGSIHEYSYKPAPKFMFMDDEASEGGEYTKSNDAPFYGVEDETDSTGNGSPNKFARALASTHIPVYCKHDGSLDNGAEVVTYPCTIKYHLESNLWDTVEEKAKEYNMKSHDTTTCGLHVHISRAPFEIKGVTDYEEKFIYALDHFKEEWQKVARRESSRWGAFLSDKMGEETKNVEDVKHKKDMYDRYQAVNLRNSHTIEIRIFRGTIKATTVKATLWMVHNLSMFILNGGDVENTTFVEMTGLNKSDVPAYVKEYATTRGVLTDSTPTAPSSDEE